MAGRKAVVVHAGARDQYELALALQEGEFLEQLVTEFYCPDFLRNIIPSVAAKRYKKGLSSRKVSMSFRSMFYAARMYAGNSFALNRQKDQSLGAKAFEIAKSRKAHLFFYSYYAGAAFAKPAAFAGQKKLLFQLHPHPRSVKKILQQELQLNPNSAASIQYENEFQYAEDYLNTLSKESLLADKVVVASNYTKSTLVENGVKAANITVVPYGIQSGDFFKRTSEPRKTGLRVIFVGSMVQRKGLSYLLTAIAAMSRNAVELVLCGRGFADEKLIQSFGNINLTIRKNISRQELLDELHRSDVFVLPSLSEGFAQVILEAMSAGLPVITTDHTSGPDLIADGNEGFIIPVQNAEALQEKLEWCLENKTRLFDMGQLAAHTAASYTWERFREGIRTFYQESISAE